MASAIEKLETEAIIRRIDGHIPLRGYADEVKTLLDERGIVNKRTKLPYTEEHIRQTRQGKIYHLVIAKVFEELYDPEFEKKNKKTLAGRQKLNVPESAA